MARYRADSSVGESSIIQRSESNSIFHSLAPLFVLACFVSAAQAHAQILTPSPDDRLTFQTHQAWNPRINLNAGAVMVYGLETSPEQLKSWRDHGYITEFMTGVAWGNYQDYLEGGFDGRNHWDEAQQQADGKLIQHGKSVPYMSPGQDFGQYLAKGVERMLDQGVTAIYLEEPEFWARSGWSDGFKREWQAFYREPWEAPNSSPDAQYRASKLKYMLYRRALSQVFAAVAAYGKQHHRSIPCYVATHSLINYAQWGIVSPESSLMSVGADGYIAQVWTGTSREPNVYNGILKQRTFETAFLEYGTMQNLVRGTGKRMWFLNDPIEDNPRHTWNDYRENWQSTLIASLLQRDIARYEVAPWPERIFGEGKKYSAGNAGGAGVPPTEPITIPQAYATELQVVFDALGHMQQPAGATRWMMAGTHNIGVLISDTLMFQRAAPLTSDPQLGSFYGLAMPLVARGIPVEPVQIENAITQHWLDGYKLLVLSYEGQKPPDPAFHSAIAAWVKAGGGLLIVDDDKDPYLAVREWWNTGTNHYTTPREHLFKQLGLPQDAVGLSSVGKGFVLRASLSPAGLSHAANGGDTLRTLVHELADKIALPWQEAAGFILQRGPYIVAASLDTDPSSHAPVQLKGRYLDLFDPDLREVEDVSLLPGTRGLFYDLRKLPPAHPVVLAISGKLSRQSFAQSTLTFETSGIASTKGVARISTLHRSLKQVLLNGRPLPASEYTLGKDTLLLRFANGTEGASVAIRFQ